jgi:hypothetical protein
MFNPEDYVMLDMQSGTYFCAADAVLINWEELTEDQRDTMINGSDGERCDLADDIGIAWTGLQ